MSNRLLVYVTEGSALRVQSNDELADVLAEAKARAEKAERLAAITLEADGGAVLSLVVGGAESVLAFQASFDPPYFASKGPSDEDQPYLECYLHFEHHTEFPRASVISIGNAELAAYEFLETGVRPECVKWQEV
jgi:hypothetical protein